MPEFKRPIRHEPPARGHVRELAGSSESLRRDPIVTKVGLPRLIVTRLRPATSWNAAFLTFGGFMSISRYYEM